MTTVGDVAAQYALVDAFFSQAERQAFDADDDAAFDTAAARRARNDQIHFLYMFTRFEAAVDTAIRRVLDHRRTSGAPWIELRIWNAWARGDLQDIPFLSRVEVLLEKSHVDYGYVVELYRSRNSIGHGGTWTRAYGIAAVASRMERIVGAFATT